MAVPKRKISKSRKRMRRSHLGLKETHTIACPRCKSPVMPHVVCSVCGHYRGKPVITVEDF